MLAKPLKIVKLLLCLALLTAPAAATYPGYGANVTGGAGKSTVHVTNTNDTGAGSLRAAILACTSGCNIVFDVSGTITAATPLALRNPDITIDGSTAPSPGITITGGSDCMTIHNSYTSASAGVLATGNAHNVIVKYLRFRNCDGDGIQVAYGAYDIVIEHNSVYNSGDGDIDVTYSHDVLVQWNIMNKAESGLELFAFGDYHISSYHNIYYDGTSTNSRIPWFMAGALDEEGCNTGATVDNGILFDIRENIMWLWGSTGGFYFNTGLVYMKGNIANNLYNTVSDSAHSNNAITVNVNDPITTIYIAGNANMEDITANAPYTPGCGGDIGYHSILRQNDQSSHSTIFTVPSTSGLFAGTRDNAARITAWGTVLSSAGLIDTFADDTSDAVVRGAITIPDSGTLFGYSWNAQDAEVGTVTSCTLGLSSTSLHPAATQNVTAICDYLDGSTGVTCTDDIALFTDDNLVASTLGQTITAEGIGTATVNGQTISNSTDCTPDIAVTVTAAPASSSVKSLGVKKLGVKTQ